jgi:trk system potassium uptake protein TrkA
MTSSLYIVVVGCGRLGAFLASRLSSEGNAVVVIDRNPSTFEELSPEFSGFRIEADATHLSALKQAKLDRADVLIATTHDDNVNLMVAQIAKKVYAVPNVLARVFDPKREEVYRMLGIKTISPTSVAADLFLRTVDSMKTNKG